MNHRDFDQVRWDALLEDDCRQLIHLSIREDLAGELDWTTVALVDEQARGGADLVAREAGIVAGLRAAPLVLEVTQADLEFQPTCRDGDQLAGGSRIGSLRGSLRDLLTLERTLLNFLTHLSGVATLTAQYVDRVRGTAARIYDTRKTLPGLRRLEKYAVRCGGGRNHRIGLHAALMIKDNHLSHQALLGHGPAQAVALARGFLRQARAQDAFGQPLLIELEVDGLAQLQALLGENDRATRPDLVLLDNFPLDDLKQAVAMRDRVAPELVLEASGGVNLTSVRSIAETGIDRISVGALTHSAPALDIGLDWQARRPRDSAATGV